MPSDHAVAFSRSPRWDSNVAELIEMVGPAAQQANVGFLYLTDHLAQHAEQIRLGVSQALNLDVLIGTVGFGVCTHEHEFMNQPASALLLLSLPEDSYQEIQHSKLDTISSLGNPSEYPVAIVHSDPELAERLTAPDVIGDVFLVGGLTASRSQSLQFHSHGSML